MDSLSRRGRMAGGLYLLFAILFAIGTGLVGSGNASSWTFRVGTGFELLAEVAGLITAIALYVLLRNVDEIAALVMLAIVVMGDAVDYATYVVQFSTHSVTSLAGQDEASALFSGLWLLPLAYLVLKSGYFPRIVGVVLVVAGACWLAQFALYFLTPFLNLDVAIFSIGGAGELFFVAWLLIFSARPARDRRGAAGQPAVSTRPG